MLMSLVFAFAGLTLAAPQASASGDSLVWAVASPIHSFDLIEWKVGDEMDYDVAMFGMNLGKNVKVVTQDEGTALWLRQTLSLMGRNEVIDALINKADGKILKLVRNGQEQPVPDEQFEVISQDYAEITVPAGHFQAIHILGRSRQASKIEIWVNPRDTALDGSLKTIMQTQMGELTMVLTAFKRNP